MERERAKRLIINTFENSFNKENYISFLKNLLKSYVEKNILNPQEIPLTFREYINSFELIGKYSYDDKVTDLLIVELKRGTSVERARATQRNFVAWYLRGRQSDAALVAFVSPDSEDWRFSLVKMEYRYELDPSGKTKVKEEFTPAKRYSFLVGKNEKSHTAQSRLLPIIEDEAKPSFDRLEEAFNVEVVTKEFFEKYRDLFIRTKLELDKLLNDPEVRREFEKKNINTVDFAKKLLGQITFLYFLQKKGWFGVKEGERWGTGPKDFIRRLFNKEFSDYSNFYNDILEPLFYEALRTDRRANDSYYSRFECRIPFLNGGLFDPINNFDWVNIDILLPNDLFSNPNEDGILDIFDIYNFTVNEEEPLEKEVALDPELLGKIYEKLNAIRPDNFEKYVEAIKSGKKGEETKFNKEFGVYYTPRDIVHYICQQSLIHFLEAELAGKATTEDIETLVKNADLFVENGDLITEKGGKIPESIRKNAEQIDKLLKDITVCDPAVGSGAFPIGMMHEIVKLRQLLSVYVRKKINTYDLKRQCIENSLFGVDIDSGAVEICRLRFWLSLVVDEEDPNNIKPLPNLDYKVVRGNSLLGFPENLNSSDALRIEELQERFFKETDPLQKNQIKNELDKLIRKRMNYDYCIKTFGYPIDFDFRVFFPQVFHRKGGFDIVIANPPYVRQERIKDQKKFLERARYKIYNSTSDLYTYFYEKGLQILKPKGLLCFITSNKWMRAKYGGKLRQFLKNGTEIIRIIDFCGHSIFDATVDTNIILLRKKRPSNEHFIKFINVRDLRKDEDVISFINNTEETIFQSMLDDRCWTLANHKVLRLKEKIEKIGKSLKNWDVRIYRGAITGFNEAFIIDSKKREEILNNCKDEKERERTEETIKPVLRGRDIGRYYYKWPGLWLIKIEAGWTNKNREKEKPEEFFKRTLPAIYQHLISFRDFKGKGKGLFDRDDQGDYWWELRYCDYYQEFEKEKIVWQEMSGEPAFCFDNNKFYTNQTAYIATGKNLKYILGVLNSKISYFYLKQVAYSLGNEANRWIKQYVERIPIPPITPQNQQITKQIESLVDKILTLTQSEDYLENQRKQAEIKEYEHQIDKLVYSLYELSEEEKRLIEESLEK